MSGDDASGRRAAAFDGLCETLTAACERVYGDRLRALAVFGSWARGEAAPLSDIDVLVVADPLPPGRLRRMAQFAAIDAATAGCRAELWPGVSPVPDLAPVFKTLAALEEGSPLFLGMTVHCRILSDRDGVLAGRLDRLRLRMKELGTTWKTGPGGGHWDYKPDWRPSEVIEL